MREERPQKAQTFKLPDGKGDIERETHTNMLGCDVICFVGRKGWGQSLVSAFA